MYRRRKASPQFIAVMPCVRRGASGELLLLRL